MKRTKIIVDGVPIVLTEDDGLGDNVIELCGKLAEEADIERMNYYKNKLEEMKK